MILGLDETGRGAVLGPLVICGLAVDEKGQKKLKKLGVKDSKLLSPKKREELAPKIEKIAIHTVVMHISSCKIDANRRRGVNLNQIEALTMAEIINMVNPDKVIVDSPTISDKFKNYLWSKIENKKIKLIAENYADKNYPVVSAASIIAKVSRDEKIRELEKKIGEPLGVGYPHDSRTIEFLEKTARENNGKFPRYVRQTWDTVIQIKKKHEQKGILGFLKKIVKT